jgi:aquaporin NIP
VNAVIRTSEEHFYGTEPRPPGAGARLPFLLELLASAVLMIVIATVARSSAVRTPYRFIHSPLQESS